MISMGVYYLIDTRHKGGLRMYHGELKGGSDLCDESPQSDIVDRRGKRKFQGELLLY